jgi:hypothetical protein
MNNPKRKFLSEFAVSLFSSRFLMIPASEVGTDGELGTLEAEIAARSHIYLICKRPGFTYCPETFSYAEGTLSGKLQYKVRGKSKNIEFSIPFPLVDGAVSVGVSPYPHREIQTRDASGEGVRRLPASMLSLGMAQSLGNDDFRNLEVLYVGQAYAEGRRTAFERIRSHSTLQKILAQVHYSDPDAEVYVLVFEYPQYRLITRMDGMAKEAISDDRDSDRFSSILDQPLTAHQQISLVEAGLIRFFEPIYNEIYKATFPSPTQKILQSCFQLDFSALVVEIDTSEIGMCLFSESIGPNSHHIAQFNLIDPTERMSFFAMITEDGSVVSAPDVISPPSGSSPTKPTG